MASSKFEAALNETEEVEYTVPYVKSGGFRLNSSEETVHFQASNTDANFGELGVVNSVKLKHRGVWDYSSGKARPPFPEKVSA